MTSKRQTLKLKLIVGSVVLGTLISLATGLLLNESGMSIPEIKRYGHPLAWFVTNMNGPTEFILTNLAINVVFWVAVSILVSLVLTRVMIAR